MLDFDAGKLIIVGVIALIFIPPKDLPRFLRQAGQFVGKMRRMAADFQGQFMDAMREADLADLRKEAQKLADAARVDTSFDAHIEHLKTDMSAALDSPPRSPEPLTREEGSEPASHGAPPAETPSGNRAGLDFEAPASPESEQREPADRPVPHSA